MAQTARPAAASLPGIARITVQAIKGSAIQSVRVGWGGVGWAQRGHR